jgi:rod shape-determining protein MreB
MIAAVRRWPWPACRRCPAIAIDLGSARTRAWTAGRHGIIDVPTVTDPDNVAAHPVQRGTIVDPAGTARMLSRLIAHRIPKNAQPVIAFTMPVLSGRHHYTTAVGVLRVLRPRTVLALDSVMAIALATGADPFRPLLVIDLGAHLTEVALLADGEILTARREAKGTRDLEQSSPADLVTDITALMTNMMRGDPLPQFVDALDRGPLLAGGGALRPELVHQLSAQLHAPVQPVPQPHTAAVRGAAQALRSAQHHPSLGPPLHPIP